MASALVAALLWSCSAEAQVAVLARMTERDAFDEVAPTTDETASEADEEAIGASVGEGGRDLAARVRWQLPNRWFATVELQAAAGADPMLIGFGAEYLRWQPVYMVGYQPLEDVSVFGGAGVGAAHIMPESGSIADGIEALHDSAGTSGYSVAAQVGVRVTSLELPLVALLRTDDVSHAGFAARLALALELSP